VTPVKISSLNNIVKYYDLRDSGATMEKSTMRTNRVTRRNLVLGLAAIPPALSFASHEVHAIEQPNGSADAPQGISRSAIAIHQEVEFQASRQRVYHALTDARAFDRVVRLSAAVKSAMIPASAPRSHIGRRPGAGFSLFGGYVTGLQVELVHDQRIVQVWRAGSWNPGEYSLAGFVLADQGSGCRLVFDHRGFPPSEAQHLADGWHDNYWQPLAQALASA
jgi:activator of HSP90 ATPase